MSSSAKSIETLLKDVEDAANALPDPVAEGSADPAAASSADSSVDKKTTAKTEQAALFELFSALLTLHEALGKQRPDELTGATDASAEFERIADAAEAAVLNALMPATLTRSQQSALKVRIDEWTESNKVRYKNTTGVKPRIYPYKLFQGAVRCALDGLDKKLISKPAIDVAAMKTTVNALLNSPTDREKGEKLEQAMVMVTFRLRVLEAKLNYMPDIAITQPYIAATAALTVLSLLPTGYLLYTNLINPPGAGDPYMSDEMDFLVISIISSLTFCASLAAMIKSNSTTHAKTQENLRTMTAAGLVALAGISLMYACIFAFTTGYDALHRQEEKGLFTLAYLGAGLIGAASAVIGMKVFPTPKLSTAASAPAASPRK